MMYFSENLPSFNIQHEETRGESQNGGVHSYKESEAAVSGSLHVTTSVSVKRRHSIFDAQNFGQNAQKRKTVRQVTQRIFR